MAERIVEIVDVSAMRGGARVLDAISLTIDRGEHTAILGPNGAGKSTLLRLLMLEQYPLARPGSASALRWFGRDRWDVAELRQHLGIVSPELDAHFARSSRRGRVDGLEAVVSGFLATQGLFAHQHVTDGMWERARSALVRAEAGHLASKPLVEMSIGEKRRVLIARALVHDPAVLLLDEPTTGLDLVARQRFMETVRQVATPDRTVVLVTHHVDEVTPEIGRVILLRDGRIAADGPASEVMTSRRISDAYGAPLVVERHGGYYAVRPGVLD